MITADDIIAEIRRLDAESVEGFTMLEMVDATGYSVWTCRRKIKQLIGNGRACFVGMKRDYNSSGVACKVPVYRLLT